MASDVLSGWYSIEQYLPPPSALVNVLVPTEGGYQPTQGWLGLDGVWWSRDLQVIHAAGWAPISRAQSICAVSAQEQPHEACLHCAYFIGA